MSLSCFSKDCVWLSITFLYSKAPCISCSLCSYSCKDWIVFYFQINTASAKSLQSCPTLCNPRDGSLRGSPSLGFSRQENWSGLPFPSPMHESEKWKWSREVAQSCPTLSDPMDCSPPGSSIHGIFQARVLEWGAIAFSKINVMPFNLFCDSPYEWPCNPCRYASKTLFLTLFYMPRLNVPSSGNHELFQ